MRLHHTLPAGVASEVAQLLGVYSLMTPGTCFEHTPDTTLSLYATADGTLRYTWLQELAAAGSFSGYGVDEGTVQASGTSVTFTPEFVGGCPSKVYAYADEAPTYPPSVLVSASHCTAAQLNPTSTFAFTYGKSGCATQDYDQLQLTAPAGAVSYMKTGLTITGFPGTTGTGAHFIWTLLR